MAAASSAETATKRISYRWALWTGVLVVNCFVIAMVASVIVHDRQRAIGEIATIGDNYANTIEANFLGFVRRIDVTLLTVVDEVVHQRAQGGIRTGEFEAFLARQDSHIPEARGLRVIDVQGNIRYAVSGVSTRGANIGDRPYFIRVRDDPNAGLVFSDPIMGRASNMLVVTLSRRVSDPDGSFAGEVNVAVAVDRFISMLSLLDLGAKGSASLWSSTRLIARYARDDTKGAKTGMALPSSELRGLIESGKTAGRYHIVTRIDNVERLFHFRRIGDYPLYVVIGLADEDFLAEWRRNSIRLAALAAAFLASTLLFAGLAHRGLRRRERAEADIHALNAELEARVRDRTAELEAANAKLVQALDAAETASRAKNAFLANMSHELRTPLNVILGFAQIMERDTSIPEDERANIGTIIRSGSHLLALINNILEVSRIESGRVEIVGEAFDLGAALAAVEDTIRLRTDDKGLVFVADRRGPLPNYAVGDAYHLRQVLMNLLGNAVKYTERGEIRLTVTALAEQQIRFEVADNGPGIMPEDQERIFESFYQTEAGFAKGEGTGLGLSISRELVRLMGGELTVQSSAGGGSLFAFTIPLPATADTPVLAAPCRVAGLAPGQAPPRILVAEDQPDNQMIVERMLARAGCQVKIAANGEAALGLYREWHPQMILMDMRMPVMDGLEAARRIRAAPGGDRLPIVALTASTCEEDRNKVLAAGCNETITKPIDEGQLFEVIGRLLGVRFEAAADAGAKPRPAAGICNLAALTTDTLNALAEAAAMLDKEATLAIAERIAPQHPAEARLIADLVAAYRFDRVQELCR